MSDVRVRIAPSPTGDPHVGTAYIALFNQIFARHHKGKFILRIEDTDQSRSRREYEENIYKALHWANLQWDEGPDIGGPFGPYRQSERLEIYKEHAEKLVETKKAYKCYCTSERLAEMREVSNAKGGRQGYDRLCRNLSEEEIKENDKKNIPYVIRLKVPLQGECIFQDTIRGRVVFPYADIDDQVLMKTDGFPTYHLANVVDDHLMKITHVIRGDEWISSTPKHMILYEVFGWTPPQFIHMPLLLGTDGKKLSKRKNPTSIFFYRDSGYLPEAFVNFLTLMGYSMPGDLEIYPLETLIEAFDPSRCGVSGAVFDIQKLNWLNQHYIINNIKEEHLLERLKEWRFNDAFLNQLMPLAHTRIKTFGEFFELCDFFFVQNIKLNEQLFTHKGTSKTQSAMILQCMIWFLEEQESWRGETAFIASKEIAKYFGINHKKVVMPALFGALMGKHHGPPLFDSIDILGRDTTRARFLNALLYLDALSKKTTEELKKCWKSKEAKELFESHGIQ